MPELLPTHVSTRARRMTLSMACTLSLLGLPAGVLAQSVPAGLRACTAEADAGRRLACYDTEMARLRAPAARNEAARAGAPTRAMTEHAVNPIAKTPPAAVAGAAAPKAAATDAPAPRRSRFWNIFSGGGPSQLTAHVASLERWPNAMVLHLDNGQVWQQTGRASGDLSLHPGDEVTIVKHLGSYWLSSRYVSNMQVRRKPQ